MARVEEVSTATEDGGADEADRLARETGRPIPPVPTRRRRAPFPIEFYRSDVGKKWVMAVTGVIGMGFVFAHMVGNLHIFEGPDQINHYGEWLRELFDPPFPRTFFLWSMRIVLLVAIVLHRRARFATSRSATTSPPRSPPARCAGRA
jgi:succinate dehydrogenase / fumarate reductase cytochrome b subunit